MSDPAVVTAYFAGVVLVISAGSAAYVMVRKELSKIHSAVNSNMTQALKKIDELYLRVEAMTAAEAVSKDRKKRK